MIHEVARLLCADDYRSNLRTSVNSTLNRVLFFRNFDSVVFDIDEKKYFIYMYVVPIKSTFGNPLMQCNPSVSLTCRNFLLEST